MISPAVLVQMNGVGSSLVASRSSVRNGGLELGLGEPSSARNEVRAKGGRRGRAGRVCQPLPRGDPGADQSVLTVSNRSGAPPPRRLTRTRCTAHLQQSGLRGLLDGKRAHSLPGSFSARLILCPAHSLPGSSQPSRARLTRGPCASLRGLGSLAGPCASLRAAENVPCVDAWGMPAGETLSTR